VKVLVVKTEEELKQRLDEGWRIYRDEFGFTLYNPQTKRKERIDKSLYHLCEHLYNKMKQEKGDLAQAGAEEGGAEEGEAEEGGAEWRPPAVRPLDRALREDVKLIVSTIKQRLDPKAPIITKWTENIAWWNHLIMDTATYLLPELLSLLRTEEIDLANPEMTAKNMVSKFKAVRETARRAEEVEGKYMAEIESLKRRVADLESILDKCMEVIREQGRLIEDLADKAKKTIAFFVVYVPNYLPEDARAPYRALAAKVKEIWGGGGE
jgi:hypothetical protein